MKAPGMSRFTNLSSIRFTSSFSNVIFDLGTPTYSAIKWSLVRFRVAGFKMPRTQPPLSIASRMQHHSHAYSHVTYAWLFARSHQKRDNARSFHARFAFGTFPVGGNTSGKNEADLMLLLLLLPILLKNGKFATGSMLEAFLFRARL